MPRWYLMELIDTTVNPHQRHVQVRQFPTQSEAIARVSSDWGGNLHSGQSITIRPLHYHGLSGANETPAPQWSHHEPVWSRNLIEPPTPRVSTNPLAHGRRQSITVGRWQVNPDGYVRHLHGTTREYGWLARRANRANGTDIYCCPDCTRTCTVAYLVRGLPNRRA